VKGRDLPLGYVEDLNDARTPLADFFSILLEVRGIIACGCMPLKARLGYMYRLRGVEPCVIQTRTQRGRGVRSASTFYHLERLWPQAVKKIARRERSIGRMSRV
jgi:hypothetical protein